MNKSLIKLFKILDHKFKKKILLVQILLLFAALLEMLSILSIAPLMQLISDVDVLDDRKQFVTKIYYFLGIFDYSSFVIFLSLVIFSIFFLNFIIAISTVYIIEKFSQEAGNFLKLKIFQNYSNQPWIMHSQRNTSTYTSKIILETTRISQTAILPLLSANAKLLVGFAIISFIFVYNPKITMICFIVFFISYLLIFKFVKKKIDKNGAQVSLSSSNMFKKIFETFGGIKETILHKKQKKFYDDFNEDVKKYSKAMIYTSFFKNAPKLCLELIAFSIIIFSIIYTLSNTNTGDLKNSLPILAIYTLAGYKLLPIFQSVYYGILSVRSAVPAIDSIYSELKQTIHTNFENQESPLLKNFSLKKDINLEKVDFAYINSSKPAIQNVSMNIPANSITCIVGPSGSGKSTILDILLGLLKPQRGRVLVDGEPLNSIIETYQNSISYVGQNIFLKNESIQKNICFGLDNSEIDQNKLTDAIQAANLTELIEDLPLGIETQVGEGGIKISGGQRQRVAIARALYLNRSIIILDEATSSLDGISENYILGNLKKFASDYNKTIIMVTHKISLTKLSDIIYLVNKGSVIESGIFNVLLNNDIFKKLLND